VVIGDLSQRQMVMKEQQEKHKPLNRLVYNDWVLHKFMPMLKYICLGYGKELSIMSERDTSKTCSHCSSMQGKPLWKRIYTCTNCGLKKDQDENSAINILQRFVARAGPHT